MGKIRARNDNGKLFFDFRYQGRRCREQTDLVDGRKNRRKLEKVLEKIEAEIALGTFEYERYFPNSSNTSQLSTVATGSPSEAVQPETPLFRDFAEEWIVLAAVQWKESHHATVRGILDRYLLPRFGDTPVGEIARDEVLRFRTELTQLPSRKGGTLSPQRINHIMTALRMILTEAKDRYDLLDPFRGIKPLKVGRTEIHPFSLDEVQLILRSVRPDFRNYFLTRFFTGLRTGEIDGLQWRYVDFERRQILVRETLVRGRVETPKTDGSIREVDMVQPVYEALQNQAQATRGVSPFVFPNGNGGPLDHTNVTARIWYPLLRNLGLEKRRPYQTRHTAATLWLAAGENPEWIARQLGHTSTEMLFRVYSRYVPNMTRRDGSAVDQLLQNQGFTHRG